MTGVQMDMFGGAKPVLPDRHEPTPSQPTCWTSCKLCSPTLHKHRNGSKRYAIYRICSATGGKCYECTPACFRRVPLNGPPIAAGVTRGWDDY